MGGERVAVVVLKCMSQCFSSTFVKDIREVVGTEMQQVNWYMLPE